MALVRTGYVEIGADEGSITLTPEAALDLRKRLRVEVKAREQKREDAA